MRLQTMLVLMAPFVLVALFHSHRLTGALTSGLSGGGRPRLSLIGAGRHAWRGGLPPAAWRPPVDEAELQPISPVETEQEAAEVEPEAAPEHVLELSEVLRPAPAAQTDHASDAAARAAQSAAAAPRRVLETKHYEPPVSTEPDPSAHWPAPTLSPKKLLDGSSNWLPVPDAEGAAPSDLAWRAQLSPGMTPPHCPPGRRPYHTILTAQDGYG